MSLYLLVLTGFGTLAGTGTLDAPTVVLVGMALLVRGFLLSKRRAISRCRRDGPTTSRWGMWLFMLADYDAVLAELS